jgi:hypothetical protein
VCVAVEMLRTLFNNDGNDVKRRKEFSLLDEIEFKSEFPVVVT